MRGIRLGASLAVILFLLTASFVIRSATSPNTHTPKVEQATPHIASEGNITSFNSNVYDSPLYEVIKAEVDAQSTEGDTESFGMVLGASDVKDKNYASTPATDISTLAQLLSHTKIAPGQGLSIKKGKMRCRSASDETFGCISPGDFENFSEKLSEDALEDSESLASLIGDGTGNGALVFGNGATLNALSLSDVATSSLLATNASGVVVATSSITVQALNVLGIGTTTFQHGISLATGCFAVGGVCITGGGGGIATMNGLIGATQSFATSSDTNIGIAISSVGNTHTFTPSWSGALGVSRGGTGTTTSPGLGQLLIGNTVGGYELVSTSSLGITASQWLSSGANILYQSGVVSIGTSTANAMLQISDTSNATGGLYIASSQSTPAGSVNLATFETTNANWDRPLVRINDISTNGGAANVRLDSPNPDIEFIETDQTAPQGKFELAGSGNRFQVNSRDAGNSAFETILEFAQKASTFDVMTLYMNSNSASRDAVKIVNQTSSAGAQPGISWRSDASSYDYARLSALTGASSQNSKFLIEVADVAKQLQTRFVIDRDGFVGIGTTTPTAQLSTTGTVRFSNFGAGTLTTDANGNVSVSSDERLKNIAGVFSRGLDAIMGIQPISYRWKEVTGFDTANVYTGFSAQNIQEFIPEAIGEDKHGFLTLSDRPLLATLINAVKDIAEKIEALSQSITTGEVRTEKLCVGNTCVTEAEFMELVGSQNNGGQGDGTGGGEDTLPMPPPPPPPSDEVVSPEGDDAEEGGDISADTPPPEVPPSAEPELPQEENITPSPDTPSTLDTQTP
ncbi:MAG: hypothetical protein RLZZ234_843 [Candidatus Parcubacteria bacterium]|jgi:hypothetical protein